MKPSIAWAAVAASAVIIGLLSGGSAPAAVGRSATLVPAPSPRATLTELIQDVGGRGASTAPQRFGYLGKIDSHLQDVAASRLGRAAPRAPPSPHVARASRCRHRETLSPTSTWMATRRAPPSHCARSACASRRSVDRSPQRMVEGFLPPGAIAAGRGARADEAIGRSARARLSAGSTPEGRRRHQRARGARARADGGGRVGRDHLRLDDQRRRAASPIRSAPGTCRPDTVGAVRIAPAMAPARVAPWPRSSTTRRPG